jgi:Spy/CpxP family protein refolding chaperone
MLLMTRFRKATVAAAMLLPLMAFLVPVGFGQEKPADPKGAPAQDCCKMMQDHPDMAMGGGMMRNRQPMGMARGMMPAGPQAGMGPNGPRPRMMLAQARHPRGPMGDRNRPGPDLLQMLRLPEIQKNLGITEEQRKKLEDLAFNTEKTVIQSNASLQVQRLELARLERAENADRAAIDKKISEIAQTEASLMRARINARLDMRGMLSKEQREIIQALIQERGPANPRPMGARPMGMPKANPQPAQPKPQE